RITPNKARCLGRVACIEVFSFDVGQPPRLSAPSRPHYSQPTTRHYPPAVLSSLALIRSRSCFNAFGTRNDVTIGWKITNGKPAFTTSKLFSTSTPEPDGVISNEWRTVPALPCDSYATRLLGVYS